MQLSSLQNETWFLKGGGEIGNLIETQFRDSVGWSETLKSALSLTLNSKIPAVLFWGPDHICFYNDACVPILGPGRKHPWALGKSAAEIWPALMPVLDLVLSKGQSICENEGFSPGYCNKLFEDASPALSYAPVYGKEGVPSGVLVTCIELPAWLRTIGNLENHGKQFQNLVRQLPVGMIVLTGEEMRVEVVNEMYGRLIGRTPEELLDKRLFDVIPESEKDLRPILDNVRLSQNPLYRYAEPYSLQIEGERTDGFMDLVYQPYRESSDGRISGVMVICHDVTEQINSRKRTEAEKAKAKLAIESAELGTYEINLLTQEIKTSARFNSILRVESGVSSEQLASLIHPDDKAVMEAAYKNSIKTGNLHCEVRVVSKDKAQRWVKVKGRVLFDVNHKATVLVGVTQDITEQRDFADELRKLVDERTKELQTLNEELAATNEELSETNVHLTRANKDLEEFAYVASHDLQEPLRKIQTFAHIIDERFADELSDAAAGYLSKVTASARRMSSLIKDLLDYSRLTFNDSLFQSVDLNAIVKNVISDFEVLITQKRVVVNTSELPVIQAIPIQMNQLFYNLIGNAIKFSRKGVDPEITIISRPLEDNGVTQYPHLKSGVTYHEITITDNGIGFSQEYAEQIFAIFQRLNDRTIYGGYGIGLALCRKIVDHHKGYISAMGQENEGASFTVVLPEYHT